MRFAAGKRTQLPVTPEAIRIRMNQTLSNMGKVADKTPYIREARSKLEIGCIYLTLADHTADQVWSRLDRCRSALLRELGHSGLTDFAFSKDVRKVKILVYGVPFAPTGRGSVWKPEDWTGDRAFDGLRCDIEGSNLGIVATGRPSMLGSVYAMKQAGATSCGIRFVLEKNDASDKAISTCRIFLFGKSRNVQIFTEHRTAPVCNKCLQVGHFEALCAFPPCCRFCFGDHLSRQHHCGQLNCPGEIGQSCSHTVRRCMLCDRSDHFTGYDRCPTIASPTPSSSAPTKGAATPIAADDTSVTGITDRSRNRARRRKMGFAGTPLPEVMAEQEVSAKGISTVASVVHKEVVKSHRRGLTPTRPPKVDRKGKGKAVDDYEKAGPSRIEEVVEPAPSGNDKATGATPPPIPSMTIHLWAFPWACLPPTRLPRRAF